MDNKAVEKRFKIMTGIVFLIFAMLLIQLGNLQLVNADLYKRLSEGNRIRILPISAPRGNLIDRYGRVIATNRPGFTVSYLDMGNTDSEKEYVFETLSKILEIPRYTPIEEEKYTVPAQKSIRLKQRPIVDMNGDGNLDLDDVIIKSEEGNIIKPVKINYERGTVYLDIEPGKKIYISYVYDTIKNKIQEQGYKRFVPVRLKTDVSFETVARIEERRLPGVIIQVEPIRHYVYGETASHVIGYIGEINKNELEQYSDKNYSAGDYIGKEGLERVLELYLKGQDGGKQVEVTATGEFIRVLGEENAVPGNSVFLTLDLEIQKTAETALKEIMNKLQNDPYKPFPNAKKGAVVVMKVKTGEILALVSEPAFNPNLFAAGISQKEWEELSTDPLLPLFNRAVQGTYPPGSVFKMVTAAAALEKKVVTPTEIIDTNGGIYWTIAPKKCWAWQQGGHGRINIIEGLAKSCNIFFYEMGRRVGIDALEEYARKFGLGEKTGIELPREQTGTVAGRSYKEKIFTREEYKRWYPAETLDAAIGQGFHSYTPLQIARYVSAIANGGDLVKPYLVKKIVNPQGEVIEEKKPEILGHISISRETMDIIKKGMKAVVEPGGTAWGPLKGFPIPSAGKTGTAQWDIRYDNHGWFAGFAPYDDPEIAVVVFIEQAGSGGATGAPVARAIYEKYFKVDTKEVKDYLIKP